MPATAAQRIPRAAGLRATSPPGGSAPEPAPFGLGRDEGPFSTRNSSKGALVGEAHAVFGALGEGASIAEVRAACLAGKLLRQRARETRNRIWDALHWRYFAWGPAPWVLADMVEAARAGATDARFTTLLYLHYARRDRLVFDLVTGPLWDRWRHHLTAVQPNDVLDFLLADDAHGAAARRWHESTRVRLAGSVLSALRDFGVLRGVYNKALHRLAAPLDTTLHLCRLLHAEGLRGRALLQATDFRLFLWEPHDVAAALGALAQRGDLRFERSGRTVMLDIPDPLTGAIA